MSQQQQQQLNKSIFIGRNTKVSREEFHHIQVEAESDGEDSSDELPRIASDIMGNSAFEHSDKGGMDEQMISTEVVSRPAKKQGTPAETKRSVAKKENPSSLATRKLRPRPNSVSPQPAKEKTGSKPQAATKKRGRGRPRKETTASVINGDESSVKTKGKGKRKEEEWEVEAIVDSMIEDKTMTHWYLVKWKGFSSQQNTWEPKKNLAHCQVLLERYESKAAGKKG